MSTIHFGDGDSAYINEYEGRLTVDGSGEKSEFLRLILRDYFTPEEVQVVRWIAGHAGTNEEFLLNRVADKIEALV